MGVSVSVCRCRPRNWVGLSRAFHCRFEVPHDWSGGTFGARGWRGQLAAVRGSTRCRPAMVHGSRQRQPALAKQVGVEACRWGSRMQTSSDGGCVLEKASWDAWT
ncbi:hypothetical protein GOP47_0012221 [Adiantum capillus-veneris]|uniref:Uncharacterized protein n=1 Tax=Adiantum capillus-veneris TaxID=13818 RepID=A0A9D4ZGA9_ADICA|nr:hypothetical protein GOP47_0012221 [Adiantum capillus-veneris]